MTQLTPETSLRDLVQRGTVTVPPSATLRDVAEVMAREEVGAVVVVVDGRAAGVLSERDVVGAVANGDDVDDVRAEDVMAVDLVSASVDDTVAQAAAAMLAGNIRHLPVVEGGALVGIVSMRDLMKVASIEPVTHPGHIEAPKGLAGVIVAETEVGDVRGQEGFYHYRQYSAVELAEKRSLEDVWYLLFEGELPTEAHRASFLEEIRANRTLPDVVRRELPAIASAGQDFVPLDGLRTAVSLLGASLDFKASLDISAAELRQNAMQVCAVIPTILTALHRLREGNSVIEPHPTLGYAANYLYMLTGEEPGADEARGVEQYLITTIDHGFNASTFTARVITSTGADLVAAVVGGIGALSGPLHGGAPSRALAMLDEIGSPENTEAWVRNAVENGDRIMGFGHRVYKTDDPRSVLLKSVAQRLGGDKANFAVQVEKAVVDTLAELKPGRELYANVEFYAGVVMDRCGLPREMFTPTFASSRVIGWCANILEQAADNRIIRPSARYVGPPPPQPVPAP